MGDGCNDFNHYGRVNNISQEAPVPIFNAGETTCKRGMSYNVAKNFSVLGASVTLHSYIIENKHRYIESRFSQQLFRVDEKLQEKNSIVKKCLRSMEKNNFSAIVISDYNKGTLSYKDIRQIIKAAKGKPVFIDTKKQDLKQFENCIIKINESEYEKAVSYSKKMIVTRSNKSVLFKKKNKDILSCPVEEVALHDTTGAGDTFLAAFVSYYVASNDLEKSIKFAIQASKVSIQHFGVYAPTLEEICQD